MEAQASGGAGASLCIAVFLILHFCYGQKYPTSIAAAQGESVPGRRGLLPILFLHIKASFSEPLH
jgi:hypothetical protein